jgi:hypothetical protein
MRSHNEILLNEYQEINCLRERAIQSMESTETAYFTFLGLIITAISFFYGNSNEEEKRWVIIIGLVVILIFGISMYNLLIGSNINKIIYTRMLNRTRNYLIQSKNLKKFILLEINGFKPDFDTLGFLGKKLSVVGIIGIIAIINSILIGILSYLILSILCIKNALRLCVSFSVKWITDPFRI